jgi:hypothetical protein
MAPKIDEYNVGGSMNYSVTGCVVDETTGEPLTSPDVRLYRVGVAGETRTPLNEHGCFAFSDLPEGEYSLAFYGAQRQVATAIISKAREKRGFGKLW